MSSYSYIRCQYYVNMFYQCKKYDKGCNDSYLGFLNLYSCHRYGFRY